MTPAMTICPGCHEPIDPAFDSILSGGHGEPWHTSCMVDRIGALDRGDDVDVLSASPLVWAVTKLARWWRR